MSISQGMTHAEFDRLLRLSETDPEIALRGLLDHFSTPTAKSELQTRKLDSREWNLVVHLYQEKNDPVAAARLLLNLLKFRGIAERNNGESIYRLEIFKTSEKMKAEFKINVWAKFQNASVFDLNVKHSGQLDITPGEVYEGPVFLRYLCSWLQSRYVKLIGV